MDKIQLKREVIIIKKYICKLLRKGGLTLKLITFVLFAIVITVSVQNLFIIPIIKTYIEEKSFEVSSATIERISDFSSFTLLERTYENHLSLSDAIKKIQLSNTQGIVGVSIYQRQKDDNNISFNYLAGFGLDNKDFPLDEKLLNSLDNAQSDSVTYDSFKIKLNNKIVETYRFVKPIIYIYQNRPVLLGVTLLYYDKEVINSVVEKMIHLISTITIAILLLATLFVYFIGSRLTKPILQITKAAEEVSRGNLNIKLDIKTNDQIEDLAKQFNKMIYSLQNHEKVQKFVSRSTMDMIYKDSTCQTLGAQHRTLTFLFSDIRDFTVLSETKEPQEVIIIINFYLNLQSKIIKGNGGDIDKFIGDEIMASFSGLDATKKAIKSAVEIQTLIKEENIKRKKEGNTICEVGIGINHGEVVVGNIGSNNRMDFTSIGAVVNIASRLCSFAKASEILIEKNTYDTSNSKCKVKPKEPIVAKGMSKPLYSYSCLPQND